MKESALVYLDTCVVSALAREEKPTVDAIYGLLEFHKTGRVRVLTSSVTRDEIDKIPEEHRRRHSVIYNLLADVSYIDQQRLLGFHSQWGPSGGVACPLIEDDAVWVRLHRMGLDRTDSYHVMLAVRNGCDVFLTCDERTILNHRVEIEAAFPRIKLMQPSELQILLASPEEH